MTFEEILDQAIAMLQRRGRLTYGALRRQFNLDDAYLEDLKTELIEGQRLAVDEAGRVLVWMGDTATPVSPASPASVPAPRPAANGKPKSKTAHRPAARLDRHRVAAGAHMQREGCAARGPAEQTMPPGR